MDKNNQIPSSTLMFMALGIIFSMISASLAEAKITSFTNTEIVDSATVGGKLYCGGGKAAYGYAASVIKLDVEYSGWVHAPDKLLCIGVYSDEFSTPVGAPAALVVTSNRYQDYFCPDDSVICGNMNSPVSNSFLSAFACCPLKDAKKTGSRLVYPPANGGEDSINACGAGELVCGVRTSSSYYSMFGSPAGIAGFHCCNYVNENSISCVDNTDNDYDSFKDCQDPDCNGVSAYGRGACNYAGENTKALCSDGYDNDGDGTTDLGDSQCYVTISLEYPDARQGYDGMVCSDASKTPAPTTYGTRSVNNNCVPGNNCYDYFCNLQGQLAYTCRTGYTSSGGTCKAITNHPLGTCDTSTECADQSSGVACITQTKTTDSYGKPHLIPLTRSDTANSYHCCTAGQVWYPGMGCGEPQEPLCAITPTTSNPASIISFLHDSSCTSPGPGAVQTVHAAPGAGTTMKQWFYTVIKK